MRDWPIFQRNAANMAAESRTRGLLNDFAAVGRFFNELPLQQYFQTSLHYVTGRVAISARFFPRQNEGIERAKHFVLGLIRN